MNGYDLLENVMCMLFELGYQRVSKVNILLQTFTWSIYNCPSARINFKTYMEVWSGKKK